MGIPDLDSKTTVKYYLKLFVTHEVRLFLTRYLLKLSIFEFKDWLKCLKFNFKNLLLPINFFKC